MRVCRPDLRTDREACETPGRVYEVQLERTRRGCATRVTADVAQSAENETGPYCKHLEQALRGFGRVSGRPDSPGLVDARRLAVWVIYVFVALEGPGSVGFQAVPRRLADSAEDL
jgi:hypothetical protein